MKENSRRICYTCGKKYRYCDHCPEFRNLPKWMNITCCEECHDLYVVCANFNLGKCSKEEAQSLLSKYDLSQVYISRPNMIHTLQKIYGSDEAEASTETLTEVPIEVEVPVVIEVPATEEEVLENNDEILNEQVVAQGSTISENENNDEVDAPEDIEQPKTRRRKRTRVVLDELDE